MLANSPVEYIRFLDHLTADDIALVGGKNASLGELIQEMGRLGIQVPPGFAVTADAYRAFVETNGLAPLMQRMLEDRKTTDTAALLTASRRIRRAFLEASYPPPLKQAIVEAYEKLSGEEGAVDVAVRSSATAEDLPTASFAGQQESFLYVHGAIELLDRVRQCFASLFTARAISYREQMGFPHMQVYLSVGVQRMVRADEAASGVIFTLDTESGFRDVVMVTSAFGLGENVVQGRVRPDEYYVHKPTLALGHRSLIWTKVGAKEERLRFDVETHRLVNDPVPESERKQCSLTTDEVLDLASWAVKIEAHYSARRGQPTPMDIEWAKDGPTGSLYIVQARPETIHSQSAGPSLRQYALEQEGGTPLVTGLAIGQAVASGKVNIVESAADLDRVRPGEILVTITTDPDWEPVMKTVAALVTEKGGRTSHAAIVARESGIPAVVGAEGARSKLTQDALVTVSCAEGAVGRVYAGEVPFRVEDISLVNLPRPKTRIMMNLADPQRAFHQAQLPSDGVGLARMEFIFAGWVGVHPLALTRYDTLPNQIKRQVDQHTETYPDKKEYFVDRLSQGIGVIAGAFYPRPVILRFSDFKTNEYANLLGGAAFEPKEENPMLGWRGASRYYHPEFKDGFLMEVEAVRRVRERFGLENVKVMIPFCRTPQEGQSVLDVMAEGGLRRGERDLEVYVMAEIPSNIFAAAEFAALFDGFSIGSNDLTQLMLGVDRDSERVAPLFNERDPVVKRACRELIEVAHQAGRTVGICGQAPSDYPDFAEFLVGCGIDSISVTPDVLVRTRQVVADAEKLLNAK